MTIKLKDMSNKSSNERKAYTIMWRTAWVYVYCMYVDTELDNIKP